MRAVEFIFTTIKAGDCVQQGYFFQNLLLNFEFPPRFNFLSPILQITGFLWEALLNFGYGDGTPERARPRLLSSGDEVRPVAASSAGAAPVGPLRST